jgi:hypothetical protein
VGRDDEGAVTLDSLDGGVIEFDGVFDAGDAELSRDSYGARWIGMHRHATVELACRRDRGLDLGRAIDNLVGVLLDICDPTRDHQLDPVSPGLDLATHRLRDLVGTIGLLAKVMDVAAGRNDGAAARDPLASTAR